MTKINEIYQCGICGNITEVLHPSGGTLACCGQSMNLLVENAKEAATEKHVPIITKIDGGYKVTVGEVNHPMLPEHFIEWIELIAGDEILRKNLKPGDAPEAIFYTKATEVSAREFCNLHGNWKSA
jgi:superoxide reductase